MNAFEIGYFFHFEVAELAAVRTRYGDLHQLGAALQLGFLRMTGRPLDAIEQIPIGVLRHLGEVLALSVYPALATLRVLYRRRSTLYEHQQWAVKQLGFRSLTPHRERALVRALRHDPGQALDTPALQALARRWLYQQRIVMPAPRRLRELCQRLRHDAETRLFEQLVTTIPETTRRRWLTAVCRRHQGHQSLLEWLQTVPPQRGAGAIDAQLDQLAILTDLGVPHYALTAIPLAQQRFYAQALRRRQPARLRRLKTPRQTLELVCFLRITLAEITDRVVALIERRITDLRRDATMAGLQRHRQRIHRDAALVYQARQWVDDPTLSDAAVRAQLQAVLPIAPSSTSKAAAARVCLSDDYRRVRRLLQQVLVLPIGGEPGQPVLAALDHLRRRHESLPAYLRYRKPDDLAQLVPRCWAGLVNHPDHRVAWQAFEAATLVGLQRGLRNGSLWIAHSLHYRDREHWLIDATVWGQTRLMHYLQLGLPRQAKRFLDPLQGQLSAGLQALATAINTGEVTLDKAGLHRRRLTTVNTSRQRSAGLRLAQALGTVQLPALILEVDSHTRFSWVLLGRPPRHAGELLAIYGALLAHGTEQTAPEVALMMPAVSAAMIYDAMAFLERDQALRDANDTVVEFIHRHEIVSYWGDGTLASADAMSLAAAHHLWLSRVDPRRRHPSVGLYTHLLDCAGIIYDQPIVLGQRQAGAAIEGVLRQQSTATLTSLMVDTHGFTDAGMGLAKLLGFDLCPRLKALRDRKLYVPAGVPVPDSLAPITKAVAWQPLLTQWDELARLAASVKSGHLTAVLALQRLGSAARDEPLYRALQTVGRLCRTLWLCDWFTNFDFQYSLEQQLNHGEQLHTLQRAIYSGAIGPRQGRRFEQLAAISGALTLLTNLVLAWNTHRIQELVEQWNESEKPSDWFDENLLSQITPVRYQGINFRGQFHFPTDDYIDRLIPHPLRCRTSDRG